MTTTPPHMNGKDEPAPRATRKRRAEVVDAAARAFHEKGYEATSIQDIADGVGLLKGSVYYYISSKEDVLFELLQEAHHSAFQSVLEAIDFDGDPLQRLRAFVTALARYNADNAVRMGILLHDYRSLSEPRKRLILDQRDRYHEVLRALIEDGQDQGVVCAEIDPKLATLAVMGMINTIYQWYRPAGELGAEQISAAYADLATRALACSPQMHVAGHLDGLATLPV
jgi:AcrR family transcriptional regulator